MSRFRQSRTPSDSYFFTNSTGFFWSRRRQFTIATGFSTLACLLGVQLVSTLTERHQHSSVRVTCNANESTDFDETKTKMISGTVSGHSSVPPRTQRDTFRTLAFFGVFNHSTGFPGHLPPSGHSRTVFWTPRSLFKNFANFNFTSFFAPQVQNERLRCASLDRRHLLL